MFGEPERSRIVVVTKADLANEIEQVGMLAPRFDEADQNLFDRLTLGLRSGCCLNLTEKLSIDLNSLDHLT
jgi:hypothetical protein